jgi:hypothetical protein
VTAHEYTSAERFPLTTQKGLPPWWQLLHDARTLDWLTALVESGARLTDVQERRLKELQEKAAAHPPLVTETNRCRAWRLAHTEPQEDAARARAPSELIPPPDPGEPTA